MYSTDHNEILHTPRQCNCRDVCKILLWSVKRILNKSAPNFDRISNSIEISLVGRAPGPDPFHDCCQILKYCPCIQMLFRDDALTDQPLPWFRSSYWTWTHSLFSNKCWTTPCAGSLLWRHNDHDGVSNHQPHSCLLNRLFRRRSKKTSNLRVTGLCVGNSPGPVNSPHKGPITREMFPFDDVIIVMIFLVWMIWLCMRLRRYLHHYLWMGTTQPASY